MPDEFNNLLNGEGPSGPDTEMNDEKNIVTEKDLIIKQLTEKNYWQAARIMELEQEIRNLRNPTI